MNTQLRTKNFIRKYLILLLSISMLLLTASSFAQRPTVGGEAQDFTLVNATGDIISLSDLHGTPIVLNFWATWCVPCREELPFFQTTHDEVNNIIDDVMHDEMDDTSETITETNSTSNESTEVSSEVSTDESTDESMEDTSSTMSGEDTMETTELMTSETSTSNKKLHFVIVNNNEDAQKATNFLEEINITLTSLVDASKDDFKTLNDAGNDLDKTLEVVRNYRVRGMPTTFYIDADGVIQVIKQGLITPQSMQQDLAKIGIDWQPIIEEAGDS